MRKSRERKLRDAGYQFTGHYASGPDGKALMLRKAAEYRKSGVFATVLHEVYHSRVTSSDGYSVYSKPRKHP